jgi:flagellar basal body rod protein FlgC
MNKPKMLSMNKPLLVVPALLVGMCLVHEARAQTVTYNISNPSASTGSGYADLENVNITIDTTTINNALAGGIQITEVGGPVSGVPTSYTTICTDIQGTLYLGQNYVYNTPVSTFNGPPVLTGVNPTWGAVNTPTFLGTHSVDQANASQAIQNAAYLFYTYGNLSSTGINAVGTGLTADQVAIQMASLQLAVWESLYDTTAASGKVNGTRLVATSTGSGDSTAVISGAAALITALDSQANTGNFGYAGDLLFPNSLSLQADNEPPQELFIAVPEPSTVIAGAMLLLPFGASTLRILRRNRKA